ncbi:hypothetical protein [Haloterrigena salinisoli]|uniref:hypothetical protein n=1 Tax=Haloterrigena salinisoli TaxID=3132747 RepID=UPI0030D28164
MSYAAVEKLMLRDVRNNMDTDEAARDERQMARKLTEMRTGNAELADDLAYLIMDVNDDEYTSREDLREDIQAVFDKYIE